jgi:hypothetical protein
MKILVDGKEIQVQNDIKVIYEDVVIDYDMDSEEEKHAELHATLTHEGLILDVVHEGEIAGSNSMEYGEMATFCL